MTRRGRQPTLTTGILLVEKRNHNKVHAVFDTIARAERHIKEVLPTYIAKGYLMDKTLTVDDFEIIERLPK